MKLSIQEWENKIEENLLFQDLRSMIDGVEAGCGTKSFLNKWLKNRGYSLNWKNYELTKLAKK